MRSFEQALAILAVLAKDLQNLERGRKAILAAANLNAGDRTEREEKLADDIRKKELERIDVLRDLVMFPPHHAQYDALLKPFCADGACERSVFVMTKYPDGENAARDQELQRVTDAVTQAITECGFMPRLASKKKYHANLWENVELYLLCCRRGIAIVEDKFKPLLNPNVAMEWGWMRAMGKPVLYLVEKEAKVTPADLGGLIKAQFDWADPVADVRHAVFMELTGAAPPAAVV